MIKWQRILVIVAVPILWSFLIYFLYPPILKLAERIRDSFQYRSSISLESDSIWKGAVFPQTTRLDEFNETGRTYYFIKIWGILKYYPFQDPKKDVDKQFLTFYPQIEQATSKALYNKLLEELVLSTYDIHYSSKREIPGILSFLEKDSLYFSKQLTDYVGKLCANNRGTSSEYLKQNHLGILKSKTSIKASNDFPNEVLRVWGLADYWNFIHYFYVYRDLISSNWDEILYAAIPGFKESASKKEYAMTILRLTSKLDDCHSMTWSEDETIDKEVFGEYVPNFRMTKIDSTFIVKTIRNPEWNDHSIRAGDIILKINGISVKYLFDSLSDFLSSTNKWTQQRNVNPYILSSLKPRNLITFKRDSIAGSLFINFRNYKSYHSYQYSIQKRKKKRVNVKIHQKNIAYLHIDDLYVDNFDKNMEIIRKYDKLILDIRSYPNGGVSMKLMKEALPPGTPFFKSIYADITCPGRFKMSDGFKIGKKNIFQNKQVVILVDENTQSEAEFLVMALQQHPNVTVIGNVTAGSDGNVTYFTFPGNIKTSFTGIGIVYPDGAQTQQCGIEKDKTIEPTIQSIKNNQDLILEKAIKFLTKGK